MRVLIGIILALALPMGSHAQERVAQDGKESLRHAYQRLIGEVPVGCVGGVMDEAAAQCPAGECQIPVPDESLPDADSCDPRTWVCVWPTQRIAVEEPCPAGWRGTRTVEKIYELRNCGGEVVYVPGKDTVTGGSCTRTHTETREAPCPETIDGGGWSGSIRETRTAMERLEADGTTRRTETTPWQTTEVSCAKQETLETYSTCHDEALCARKLVNEEETTSTCPSPVPEPHRKQIKTTAKHLTSDLALVVATQVSETTLTAGTCESGITATASCSVLGWLGEGYADLHLADGATHRIDFTKHDEGGCSYDNCITRFELGLNLSARPVALTCSPTSGQNNGVAQPHPQQNFSTRGNQANFSCAGYFAISEAGAIFGCNLVW